MAGAGDAEGAGAAGGIDAACPWAIVWEAAQVLCRALLAAQLTAPPLAEEAPAAAPAEVLELGSGTGCVGLVLGAMLGPCDLP